MYRKKRQNVLASSSSWYDGDDILTVKVFNMTMCRMRYQDDDDASTLCLFFLSILALSQTDC